jgi:hypothetical protein
MTFEGREAAANLCVRTIALVTPTTNRTSEIRQVASPKVHDCSSSSAD